LHKRDFAVVVRLIYLPSHGPSAYTLIFFHKSIDIGTYVLV
jgi:hypothetical protein